MGAVYLIPVGTPERNALDAVADAVSLRLGQEVRWRPMAPVPADAFDGTRRQVEATHVLRRIMQILPPDDHHAIAVTEEDLFIPMLTFVFGQAQLRGRSAVISLARLRQEFYQLPANPALLRLRVMKETLHELGHTFGLIHCPDRQCVMSIANTVQHVDVRSSGYCGGCRAILDDALRNSFEREARTER